MRAQILEVPDVKTRRALLAVEGCRAVNRRSAGYERAQGTDDDLHARLGLIRFDALKPMEAIIEGGKQTGGRNFLVVKFTEFGATFMRACGTPPAKKRSRF